MYEALVPEARTSGISFTNTLIIGLVLLSFLFLALETEPVLLADPRWQQVFAIFNVSVLIIFGVEYLARLWVAGEDPQYRGFAGRLRYMTQFYSLADLLAFLPELIVMLSGASASLVVLRVLRLARLFKIARYLPAFRVLAAALVKSRSQLFTSLAVALSLVYVAAVILYFVEGLGGERQEEFASIPRAIWWAVATLTTVGYGDVYPVTPLGRFCAGVIAIAGIGVVALPAGVFASAFSDELREQERAKQAPHAAVDRDTAGQRSDLT